MCLKALLILVGFVEVGDRWLDIYKIDLGSGETTVTVDRETFSVLSSVTTQEFFGCKSTVKCYMNFKNCFQDRSIVNTIGIMMVFICRK